MQNPAAPPVLAVADGVRLRPVTDGDVDAVAAAAAEPRFARWTTVPVPYAREDAAAWVRAAAAGWDDGSALTWAVEVDGRYAGAVDLQVAGDGGVSVGYALAASARGRGVMTAGLRTLLPWAAAHGAAVVRWQAHVGNWASRRAAWAAGVRVEGTVRRQSAQRGVLHDCWVGTWVPGDPVTPVTPWLDVPRVALPDVGAELRPWRDDDAARVVGACTDPLTRRWLPHLPSPYTEEEALGFVGAMRTDAADGHAVGWCLADGPAPGEDVGRALASVTVFGLGQGARPAEVGYWAHPDARGRGVVTAGVRAAVRHALLPEDVGGLGLPAVLLRVERGNAASAAVAHRAGGRPAGHDVAPGPAAADGSTGPLHELERFLVRAEDVVADEPSRA